MRDIDKKSQFYTWEQSCEMTSELILWALAIGPCGAIRVAYADVQRRLAGIRTLPPPPCGAVA